jgi:hypothetical protein
MIRFALLAAAAASLTACAGSPTGGSGAASLAQEQQACAEIGVAPGSGGFSRCVTNLDQTLKQDSSSQG